MAKMNQLRAIRLRRGLSQTELARRTGLARPYLSQLEAGLKSGSIETLQILSTALGVSAEALLAPSIPVSARQDLSAAAK